MVIEFPLDIQVGDTLDDISGLQAQDRARLRRPTASINSYPGFDYTPGELLVGA
jgi:hypothetical protein